MPPGPQAGSECKACRSPCRVISGMNPRQTAPVVCLNPVRKQASHSDILPMSECIDEG